jgi:hypothetical protein
MADIAINDVPRKAQYSGNTGLGPFQFTFNILNQTDIAVYKNSTPLDLSADYTATLNLDGTGSITLTGVGNGTAVILADVITILGDMALARVTDFTAGGDFQTAAVNEQLDSLVIMLQQLDEKISRGIAVSPYEISPGVILPSVETRKGKFLYFDTITGQATVYTEPIDRITVSTSSPSGGVDGDIWFKVST